MEKQLTFVTAMDVTETQTCYAQAQKRHTLDVQPCMKLTR